MQLSKKYFGLICKFNLVKRYADSEIKATDLLIDLLNGYDVTIQSFENSVPKVIEYHLEVKGKKMTAVPVCFEPGQIDKFEIVSTEENIEFNNKNYLICNLSCQSISRHTFTNKVSFAIGRNDYSKVKNENEKITGYVDIDKYEYQSRNVIVGNTNNPQNIFYSHIDTVENGSIDNLSGVLVMLNLISTDAKLLDNNLFVFAGNEELSYDFPTYWGYGYRQFEKEYKNVMTQANNIVIDCIGFGKLHIYKEVEILELGFPLSDKSLFERSQMFSCDLNSLMTIYHSKLDTLDLIDWRLIDETTDVLYTMSKKQST